LVTPHLGLSVPYDTLLLSPLLVFQKNSTIHDGLFYAAYGSGNANLDAPVRA